MRLLAVLAKPLAMIAGDSHDGRWRRSARSTSTIRATCASA